MAGEQSYELSTVAASRVFNRIMPPEEREATDEVDLQLHRRTVLKLDCLLLPFLALLFLFNALDKANVCASI